jgi:hypothetical protein
MFLVVDLSLRVLPFSRILARATAVARRVPHGSCDPDPARVAWLVEVASRYVPVDATCLRKALVLAWLLARRGVGTTLRIGVARSNRTLSAHAWLEWQGRVLLGSTGHEYLPLVRPEATGA